MLDAVPAADQQPGLIQPGEERALIVGAGDRGPDRPQQPHPGCLLLPVPSSLLLLGAGRGHGRGVIPTGGHPQPVTPFDLLAGSPQPGEVVVDRGAPAVHPGQGHHQMNVIVSMADRHPPTTRCIARPAGEPHPGDHLFGNLSPLGVAQPPVFRRAAQRSVPDRPVHRPAHHRHRLIQQIRQNTEILGSSHTDQSGISPSGDQMRIHMLVGLPRAEQVPQQPENPLTPTDLPDHDWIRRPICVASMSI